MAAEKMVSELLKLENALATGEITDPEQQGEFLRACQRLRLQLQSPTRRLDDLSYRVSLHVENQLD